MKKKTKNVLAVLGAVALLSGLFLDFRDIRNIFKKQVEISGEWYFNFQVKESSYNSYIDTVTEYKIYFIQDGQKVTGEGEKWKYKGEPLPYKEHDPIQITGTVINDTLYCKYNLKGTLRETTGSFKSYIDNNQLIGVFSGTAANVKGNFNAIKIP